MDERSDSTSIDAESGGGVKQKLPDRLRQHSSDRTSAVVERVRAALEEIQAEISGSGGVYQSNGGRITMAEICRRAGIAPVTLHGPRHKSTTLPAVLRFVEAIKGPSKAVRDQRIGPVDSLPAARQRLAAIANAYHLDMLRIVDLEARIRDLEAENEALRNALIARSENIVPLFGARSNPDAGD